MRVLLIVLLWVGVLSAEKLALVIGNSNYSGSAYLSNPIRDARLLEKTLNDLKFKVTYKENLTKAQMDEAIFQFSKKVTPQDTALFYYSGHGMQYNHINYLVPVDAHIAKASQLRSMGVDSNNILDGIINAKLAIILLDACRDNPIGTASKGSTKGLAQPKYAKGNYLISYATEIGEIANDGQGNNSPYALALANNLKKQKPIETILRNVRKEVRAVTTPQQKPYYEPHIDDEVILNQCEETIFIPAKFQTRTEKVLASEPYRYYQWEENGIKKKLTPKFKDIRYRVKMEGYTYLTKRNDKITKITKPTFYIVITTRKIQKPIDISKIPNNVDGRFYSYPATYKTVTKTSLFEDGKIKTKTVPCTP